LAVGAIEAATAVGSESGTQVLEQLVENGDGDTGEVTEDGGDGAQAAESEHQSRLDHAVSMNNHAADLRPRTVIVKKV
jgi:hypothetical protein